MSVSTHPPLPYDAPDSLPAALRADLPPQLQQIYIHAFSSAWHRHADFADREPFCHRLARLAVKRHRRTSTIPPSGARAESPTGVAQAGSRADPAKTPFPPT
jgi:cation transport regulator ChaB